MHNSLAPQMREVGPLVFGRRLKEDERRLDRQAVGSRSAAEQRAWERMPYAPDIDLERLRFHAPRVHGKRLRSDQRSGRFQLLSDVLRRGQFAGCACQTYPDLTRECSQVTVE